MNDIEQVIEELLEKCPAGFRNKHLAAALGVSRPRACQLLAPRVLAGELERTGEGRGRYIRGRDTGKSRNCFARGALPGGFWRALVESYPKFAYVALGGLALTDLRTRQQVRTALRGLPGRPRLFLVVDFEGVQSISQSAAKELFVEVPPDGIMYVEAINMEASVARTVSRVVRFEQAQSALGGDESADRAGNAPAHWLARAPLARPPLRCCSE
jgi:hypothetical protein